MSVKIITFHKALNYGAILQCLALYSAFKKNTDDVFVFDHTNANITKNYKLFKLSRSVSGNIKQLVAFPIKLKKTVAFKSFSKNFRLTKSVSPDDVFVTGSDQVWNYRASDFDKAYFLDFVQDKKRKFSYAASFGISQIPDEYADEYRDLLKSFNKITVREETGKKLVGSLCGIECETMPDPVFLLSKEEWLKFAAKKPKEKYILLYLMEKSDKVMQFAKTLSQKTGLKIYYIDNYANNLGKEFKVCRGIGPKKWLSLFANAEYVITNSFHGTAFSIIFNKSFYTALLENSSDVNSRFCDILQMFGLEDRIITDFSEVYDNKIDFKPVNDKIAELSDKAYRYIKEISEVSYENNGQ